MSGQPKVLYPRLQAQFAFYGSYHANPVNQWIHIICVPLILMTAMVFFKPWDFGALLGPKAAAAFTGLSGLPLDGAVPLAALYVLFYLYLAPALLGVGASAMIVGLLYGAHYFAVATAPGMVAAIALHVVCWLAQFAGHGVWEGRKPALLDNLFEALFMAPFFSTWRYWPSSPA